MRPRECTLTLQDFHRVARSLREVRRKGKAGIAEREDDAGLFAPRIVFGNARRPGFAFGVVALKLVRVGRVEIRRAVLLVGRRGETVVEQKICARCKHSKRAKRNGGNNSKGRPKCPTNRNHSIFTNRTSIF